MGNRLSLQSILETLLESGNVYFQPPENIQMRYPCILYERENLDCRYADDSLYLSKTQYSLTFIGRKPDDPTIDKILALPLCRFNRHYTADNLNHDVFTLYY